MYLFFDPASNVFFPKCPFYMATGYKCPGCGSQRAIHYLLNFNVKYAFYENALLVISIPYLLLGYLFSLLKNPNLKVLKWRKILYGKNAIIIVLFTIIIYWIFRNINV